MSGWEAGVGVTIAVVAAAVAVGAAIYVRRRIKQRKPPCGPHNPFEEYTKRRDVIDFVIPPRFYTYTTEPQIGYEEDENTLLPEIPNITLNITPRGSPVPSPKRSPVSLSHDSPSQSPVRTPKRSPANNGGSSGSSSSLDSIEKYPKQQLPYTNKFSSTVSQYGQGTPQILLPGEENYADNRPWTERQHSPLPSPQNSNGYDVTERSSYMRNRTMSLHSDDTDSAFHRRQEYSKSHRASCASTISSDSSDRCPSPRRVSALSVASDGVNRRRSSTLPITLEEVDFDLYSKGEEVDPHVLSGLWSIHSCGRLNFSVVRDIKNGCVVVNILKCAHLHSSIKSCKPDFLKVTLTLDPAANHDARTTFSSQVIKHLRDPVLEESFCFTIDGEDLLTPCPLTLTVVEFDKYSRPSDLGSTTLDIARFDDLVHEGNVLETWRDLIPPNCLIEARGQLTVSLCYMPEGGTLRIQLSEYIELTSPYMTDTQDLYTKGTVHVTTSLLSDERIIRHRRSNKYRHANYIHLAEEYNFSVTQAMMPNNLAIAFTVHLREASGQSHKLGKAVLSAEGYAQGQGLEHWRAMIQSPGKSVECCHLLL